MKFKDRQDMPPKYILLIFTVICLILLLLSLFFEDTLKPLKYITGVTVTPMQSGINSVGVAITDKLQTLQDIQSLQEENAVLKEQLEAYSNETKEYQQDIYELERLRDLYELDEKYPSYEKVAARVISKDAGNWFNVFYIDKGTNDGIQVDCNVLAGNGLAGIVTEVGPDWAKVRAIIDDTSNVGATIVSNSELCTVSGDLKEIENGYLTVNYIDKSVTVNSGDELVTSHVSDKYLPGITIGYINEVTLDSNNLTQSATLVPVVDFKNIQEVLVITELKQTVE